MVFKKLAMEYAQFDLDNLEDLKEIIIGNCSVAEGPMSDVD